MKIRGYSYKQVEIEGLQMRPYPHQAAMLNEWKNNDSFLLVTKTGSGKTRATALPVLKNHESAVFVYPTNALIQDQAKAIKQLMKDEGISFYEWNSEKAQESFGTAEYVLVQISAASLNEFAKARGIRKSTALLDMLRPDKRKIILTNPDILYLIYSLRYCASSEALGHFQAYQTIVFDEFHLYGGVELAHALFLIYLAREMGAFQRVVLLSATPNPEVQAHLDRLISPLLIDASVKVPQPILCGEGRKIAHDVFLHPLPFSSDIVDITRTRVMKLFDELKSLKESNKAANSEGEYVPCIVILNSVVNAIALEDSLVESGIPRTEIAPIRGLSARSSRDVRGKTLVIGTAAIEVGIDFKTDYLIFEAGNAASFMQRFGRIGRHSEGTAFLLGDHRECQAVMSIGDDISRDDLERGITAIYPQQDARGWFVDTLCGSFTILAQGENFRKRILEDFSADDSMKSQIDEWLEETLNRYSEKMELSQMRRARRKIRRKPEWFEHYMEIDSFRTSLPNQEVWDVREKENERDWCYEADVKMLLTRAERLWYNEKHGRLYVKGYGKYRQVWFNKSFSEEREEDCCGILFTTAHYPTDKMQFKQEGHLTSVSHVMAKPNHHVFTLAPADIVSQLDWRLAWFPCGSPRGRYIIAFDGDALLLKEIYDLSKRNSRE
ncbi:type I-D CRISPR-associated helicase Cas3' [Candidatus Poribacteria bacterium]|nr:type I-D CRISPR-associated helicase Cas3' [Candidatus Poribacteria bacterium]